MGQQIGNNNKKNLKGAAQCRVSLQNVSSTQIR